MHKNIADRWVKALRSGRYKQGQKRLRKDDKHCCLGVLCRILRVKHAVGPRGVYQYDDKDEYLPESAVEKAGMRSCSGRLDTINTNLAELNDAGKSFRTIASLIEANWKDL